MDDLKHMLSAYFYELWDEHEYGSWEEAIDDFMRRSPEIAARVPVQIEELLAANASADTLSRAMVALGSCYAPAEGDSLWLQAVRDRIRSAGQATPRS